MTHGTGSPARIAQVLGLVFLLVYLVEIGLWRFLATAVLVAAFTAAVFGRGAWRHCAQAWTDLRTGRAEWTPLAVEAVVLTLLRICCRLPFSACRKTAISALASRSSDSSLSTFLANMAMGPSCFGCSSCGSSSPYMSIIIPPFSACHARKSCPRRQS